MLGVATVHSPHLYPDIEFTLASADRLPTTTPPSTPSCASRAREFFSPTWSPPSPRPPPGHRPGGRFAATTWTDLSASPYFLAQHEVITRYAGAEAAAPCTELSAAPATRLTEVPARRASRTRPPARSRVDVTPAPLATHAAGHSAIPWGARIAQEHGPEGPGGGGPRHRRPLHPPDRPRRHGDAPFTATLVTATC
ncbi:methyltransferase [Streptomyces sp. KL116D]|uniref:methyltransferase n=1 Tax=Streptomyces sp. KL116D TaxID=3045152 RepID=UPI003557C6D8